MKAKRPLEQDDIGGTGLLSGVDLDPSYDSAGKKTGFDATSAGNLNYDADFAYDLDVPRLASATLVDATNNLAASYSYHADSDYIDTVTFSRGQTETVRTAYAYDRADRLSSVRTTAVSGGATLSSHGYLHDTLGRRTRATRHDGTYWSYGYNARSEVTSAARHLSGGAQAPLAGRQSAYAYDDIGNRLHEDSGGDHLGGSLRRTTYGDGTKSGAANALNQYTLVANHGYFEVIGTDDTPSSVGVSATYDGGAKNATAAGTHNQGRFFRRELSVDNDDETVYAEVTVGSTPEGGRFIGPDNEAPTYDDDGNLLADARWDYAWNGENRLVRMETRPGAVAAGAPKKKLEFVYDHVGRRIERKVSDWSGTAWTVASHEKFLYDGWNVIARIDEFGNEQQSYLWGLDLSGMRGGAADGAGGVGGLLAVRDVSEAKIYVPAFDGNGNVMAYADSSGASVDAEFEYDAFGNTVSAFGESAGKLEIRFSSKPADVETGLVYYGYRYYDAAGGRWLNRDLIGERGGLNLYIINNNNCTDFIDPVGLKEWQPDFEFSKADCKREMKERKKWLGNLLKSGSKKKPSCASQNNCKTLTVLIKLPHSCDGMPDSLVGHSGIAIDNEYYDFGSTDGRGSAGIQWYDDPNDWKGIRSPEDIDLDDIIADITDPKDPGGVTGADNNDVITVSWCVCNSNAEKIEKWWKDLYKRIDSKTPPMYNIPGLHCTSAVAQSINCATGSPYLGALENPASYLKGLKHVKNECGGSRGQPPYFEAIARESVPTK